MLKIIATSAVITAESSELSWKEVQARSRAFIASDAGKKCEATYADGWVSTLLTVPRVDKILIADGWKFLGKKVYSYYTRSDEGLRVCPGYSGQPTKIIPETAKSAAQGLRLNSTPASEAYRGGSRLNHEMDKEDKRMYGKSSKE